ncbi:hypothetical protein [Saccharopolyspora sp. CA-218241]|uniref:hypothetical protein n=1 Tax=Saccharopolyspora sp. CA-218241 TaxID=3240027 RepID=UPI003D961834
MTAPTTARLVEDLRATTHAVRSGGWRSTDLDGGTGAEAPDAASDPMSALSSAGFGFIVGPVSFLAEPLGQLACNPDAVSTSAQACQDAGRAVTSIADSYRQSTGPGTSGWSGTAASEYLKTGAELVDGLTGLGEASQALAESATGASEVVATTLHQVTTLVNEAVGRIIALLQQALAAAQATFGASVAAAIPQAVQLAAEYGGRIVGAMQHLLASAQGLLQHVGTATKAVGELTGTIARIGERCRQDSGDTSATDTGTTSTRDVPAEAGPERRTAADAEAGPLIATADRRDGAGTDQAEPGTTRQEI